MFICFIISILNLENNGVHHNQDSPLLVVNCPIPGAVCPQLGPKFPSLGATWRWWLSWRWGWRWWWWSRRWWWWWWSWILWWWCWEGFSRGLPTTPETQLPLATIMKKLKKKDLFPHLYFNNKCTKINITTDNELNCQKVSPRLVYSCVHPGIQDTTEVIWILRKK